MEIDSFKYQHSPENDNGMIDDEEYLNAMFWIEYASLFDEQDPLSHESGENK